MTPLLIPASVRVAAAATLLALAATFIACGEGEEELAPASPTLPPAATASPTTEPASTPPPTPLIPADWLTFVSSDGLVTLRYPPNWFAEVRPTPPPSPPATSYTIGYLFSLDPSVATGPDLPRNAAKIDVEVDLPEVNDCRSQPADAIPAALGGVAGWRQTRAALADDGDFRGIFVAAYLDGRCFRVLGHFGPENHDDSIFEQIVSSFAFSQTGQ